MTLFRVVVVLSTALTSVACGSQPPAENGKANGTAPAASRAAAVGRAPFGRLPSGSAVELFTLTNSNGMEVRTIPYGAIIVSVRVPDRTRRLDDVVLGFDTLDGYLHNNPYFGAIVGRYGNRIAKGRFRLDGTTYQLATNNGPNHLHGGVRGFDKVLRQAEPFERDGNVGVVYAYAGPNGDEGNEGYPGSVTVRVTYTVTPSNELIVDYDATGTRPTPINLTQLCARTRARSTW